MKRILILTLAMSFLISCGKKEPVQPQNDGRPFSGLIVNGKTLAAWADDAGGIGSVQKAAPKKGFRGELTGNDSVDVYDFALLAGFYDGRISIDTSIMINTETNCDGGYSREDLLQGVNWLNSKGIGAGNGEPDSMPCFP